MPPLPPEWGGLVFFCSWALPRSQSSLFPQPGRDGGARERLGSWRGAVLISRQSRLRPFFLRDDLGIPPSSVFFLSTGVGRSAQSGGRGGGFVKNSAEKVWSFEKKAVLLHSQFSGIAYDNAEIAQLVEHDLAKVGVASSSLVFRSTY